MKKQLTLILFCTLCLGSLSACHKDYDCVCTDADGNQVKYKYQNKLKREAQRACDDWNESYDANGGSCSL